jgi:hypothetical protein
MTGLRVAFGNFGVALQVQTVEVVRVDAAQRRLPAFRWRNVGIYEPTAVWRRCLKPECQWGSGLSELHTLPCSDPGQTWSRMACVLTST